MTQKSEFNAEEWTQVLQGPTLAGLLVVTAHRGGKIKESLEFGKAWTEARQNEGQNELLDAIVADPPQVDAVKDLQPSQSSPEVFRTNAVEKIRESVEILEQKATPDEVDAYKEFVVQLAERIAHAHKEGGFLGIGGEEVSESEQAILDEIRAAVDSPEQQHASAG